MSTSLKLSLVVDNVDPCSVNQCKSGQDGAIFMTVILFKRKKSINQLTHPASCTYHDVFELKI